MNAIVQGSPEWFAQRAGRLTGSRVAALTGSKGAFHTRSSLMRQMVREALGLPDETYVSADMNRGKEMEPHIVQAFSDAKGLRVYEAGYVPHPDYPWLGASPDGYVGDGGLLECKAPRKIKTLDDVPHYIDQMQLQMECTGASHCWFVQMTEEQLQIDRIDYDATWLERNLPAFQSFMDEYNAIMADPALQEPFTTDPKDKVVSYEGDPEWQKAASELHFVRTQLRELKKREDELTDFFKATANGVKSAGCGVTVTPIAGRKTVDYSALLKHYKLNTQGFVKTGAPSYRVEVNI